MDRAVSRGFSLLEALIGADGPMRLSDLASTVGLEKSTVHRILGTLAELGYVRQDGQGGPYSATLKTWELGERTLAAQPIKRAAGIFLHELHWAIGETVSLAVRSDDDVLILDKIFAARPVRFSTRVGSRLPAALTVGGKAILAHSPDAGDVVERTAARLEGVHPFDPESFLAELEVTRANGYATATSQPGNFGISAAVLSRRGEPLAALSVSGAADRIDAAKRLEIIEAILSTCHKMSETLGHF